MRKSFIAIAIGATLMTGALAGCSTQDTKAANVTAVQTQNPLFQASTLQYQAPDFSVIKDEHFSARFRTRY